MVCLKLSGIMGVMKKVSVIIPVYNNSLYLDECIRSVVDQTYKNLEIIFVDDKSTDNSLDVIGKYHDNRIKVVKLRKNSGAAIARNKGVEVATGDYICFLDSDDFWVKDKIKKQVKFMSEGKYAFIYGDYAYYNNGAVKEVRVPRSITYKQLLKDTTVFTSTVMFDMNQIEKRDIYMPNIRRGQDIVTWWNVLRKGITAHATDGVLAYYRTGNGSSLSHNKFRAMKRTWKAYKTQDFGLIKRCYYFLCYAWNATKRRVRAKKIA